MWRRGGACPRPACLPPPGLPAPARLAPARLAPARLAPARYRGERMTGAIALPGQPQGLPLPTNLGGTEMRVEKATEVTDQLMAAMARLVPQLSSSNPAPTHAQLQEMVSAPAITLLLARNDADEIVGTLTLAMFRIPTGLRAWIEDVIVDGNQRGQGIGETLTRHALMVAKAAGATTVDLTSRPSREAANRLYQRVGFERRETNVYRYYLQ